MTKNTIKINRKNYNVRNSLRSMFIFEQICGKPCQLTTLMDNYIYMYSILLANNTSMELSWDDFIDAAEKDPSIITKMSKLIESQSQAENLIKDDEEEGESSDEKKN